MASCPKSFKKGGKIKGYAAGGSTSYNEKTLAANNAIAGLQSQQNNSSAVPPQQTGIGMSGASKAALVGAGLNVLGTALNANQKPKDYTYGTNAYFDSQNKADNVQKGVADSLSALGTYGQVASGVVNLYPNIANAIDKQDAYGVSKSNNALAINASQYFRPGQTINSIVQDFKRGDASLKTVAKGLIGGGVLINDENKMERAKLAYESGKAQNQAEYDAAAAERDALRASKIEEMKAARDAGLEGYKFQSYIAKPELKTTEFVAPELSKYSKFLDKKTGKSYGTQGLKDGGKVMGKGTAKSDSIKAKVEPNSFVVPAENAPMAEMLRERLFGKKEGKANLKQGDGVEVKLSNGEHLFTPDEAKELVAAGIDLKSLAPHADDVANYKNGGLTADKARIMLHEGVANGKKITDAQRRYFGWIASKK